MAAGPGGHGRRPPLFPARGPVSFQALGTCPAAHRLAMLQQAVAALPGAKLDDQELHRRGRSYTVETLRALRARLGEDVALLWLLGADAAAGLQRWHEASALPELTHMLVVARPGASIPDLGANLPAFSAVLPRRSRPLQGGAGHRLILAPTPSPPRNLGPAWLRGRRQTVLSPAVSSYIAAKGSYGPSA